MIWQGSWETTGRSWAPSRYRAASTTRMAVRWSSGWLKKEVIKTFAKDMGLVWFENRISPIPENIICFRLKNTTFGYSMVLDNPMSSHALDKTHKELIDSFTTCQPHLVCSSSLVCSPVASAAWAWRLEKYSNTWPSASAGGPGGPPSPGMVLLPGLVGQAGRVGYEDLGWEAPHRGWCRGADVVEVWWVCLYEKNMIYLIPVIRFHGGGVTFTCYWTMCYWPLPIRVGTQSPLIQEYALKCDKKISDVYICVHVWHR